VRVVVSVRHAGKMSPAPPTGQSLPFDDALAWLLVVSAKRGWSCGAEPPA
jgi:hypothetical protein